MLISFRWSRFLPSSPYYFKLDKDVIEVNFFMNYLFFNYLHNILTTVNCTFLLQNSTSDRPPNKMSLVKLSNDKAAYNNRLAYYEFAFNYLSQLRA